MTNLSEENDIITEIFDPTSKIIYKRRGFLGKGAFAYCYEIENIHTGEVFACKIQAKETLFKKLPEGRNYDEITIHSKLTHKHIVMLHSYFEDENNYYLILEMCHKQSLNEMLNRRKTLTPPEVRYFMHQILLGCVYMHENRVIHRDLKLNNLFINDKMEIKVGDFGLAAWLSHDGERRMTVCGTPKYYAPEIVMGRGHSFEVDIWSLGCIMYTLLVGTSPFEAKRLQTIYTRIRYNKFVLPHRLEKSAKSLIRKLLHPNPECRPCAAAILMDEFFNSGYVPKALPVSCLDMQPKFNHRSHTRTAPPKNPNRRKKQKSHTKRG